MKKTILTVASAALLFSAAFGQTDSVVFNFSGGSDTFFVPVCVSSITIKAFGAQGAAGGGVSAGTGGGGAFVMGTQAVTPGMPLLVTVGGAASGITGGFNGGGAGGNTGLSGQGGGGGGFSAVADAGSATIFAIAGGGGGGGGIGCEAVAAGGNGGAGGGGNGANGTDAPTVNGVAGGGAGAVGATAGGAGIGCAGFLGTAGTNGTSFTGGTGGGGQVCCCFSTHTDPSGGGGGGGFLGGGGGGGGSAGTTACSGNDKGAGGGGAGGSNFTGTMGSVVTFNGINTGNGKVVISWVVPVVTANAPQNFCVTDGVFALTGGTPAGGTWSGPGVTGANFSPSAAGVGTHSLIYSACADADTINVTVAACTGVVDNGNLNNAVALYPNPVQDKLTIESTASFGLSFVTVLDAQGKLVFQSKVTNQTNLDIDVSKWAKGSYTVRLTGTKGDVTRSILK